MKINRTNLLVAGLALGLVGLMIVGIQLGSSGPAGLPSTHTSSPQGALALYRWLGDLGYTVERLQYTEFALDPTIDALFLLSPSETLSPEAATAIVAWVEAGGTLILAENRPGNFAPSRALLRELDLTLRAGPPATGFTPTVVPVLQPVFTNPPARTSRLFGETRVATERSDLAILVGDRDGALLVGVQVGDGYVYLSSTPSLFTNGMIGTADNAAIVLNMLRRIPPNGQIRFDEIHHGFIREPSLRDLLLGSPLGWAIIYSMVVLAAYSVLRGRRFGRPVPLREETARRSSAEYVESMAGLFQRGRKADYMLSHYYTDVKRRLARPYGISPQLDDAEFVRELCAVRTDLDPAQLRDLLMRMRNPQPTDTDMVRLVAAADDLLKR
jgi:hypothetical protein